MTPNELIQYRRSSYWCGNYSDENKQANKDHCSIQHYEHMLRQRQEEANEQTAPIQNEQPNKQKTMSSNRNDLKMTWLYNMSLL